MKIKSRCLKEVYCVDLTDLLTEFLQGLLISNGCRQGSFCTTTILKSPLDFICKFMDNA